MAVEPSVVVSEAFGFVLELFEWHSVLLVAVFDDGKPARDLRAKITLL